MRFVLTKDLYVTEVFYESRVLHVVDSCTVRQSILAILKSLNVTGAAYLKDRDGTLLSERMLSSARGDVRLCVFAQQDAQKHTAVFKTISGLNSSENTVTITWGNKSWKAPSSYTVDRVLQKFIFFCTCNDPSVIYITDKAGPVAPSLTLSSTFGKLNLVLERDEENIEHKTASMRLRTGIEIPEFRLHPPATSAHKPPRKGLNCYKFLTGYMQTSTGQKRCNARLRALFFPPHVIFPTSQLRRIFRTNIAEKNTGNARIIQHKRPQKGSFWSLSATSRNTAANAVRKEDNSTSTDTGRSWWGRGRGRARKEEDVTAPEERVSPLPPVEVNELENSEEPQTRGVRFAEVVY